MEGPRGSFFVGQLLEVTFNSAISACEGAWRSGLQLLAQMAQSSLRREVISFNAAISACATRWGVLGWGLSVCPEGSFKNHTLGVLAQKDMACLTAVARYKSCSRDDRAESWSVSFPKEAMSTLARVFCGNLQSPFPVLAPASICFFRTASEPGDLSHEPQRVIQMASRC